MIEVAKEVRALRAALEAHADKERAAQEKRYLKSDLVFLGATVPIVRGVGREWLRAHRDLGHADLWRLCGALWATEIHELRSLAILILERHQALLVPEDVPALLTLVRESKTWAYVDWLAVHVFGPLVERAPAVRRQLPALARDADFWVRRTALLSLLWPLRRGAPSDFELFARLARPLLGETEFFIRKAIGWVLREVGKKQPALVYEFVRAHRDAMAGLSVREAIKYLPASQQRELAPPKRAAAAPAGRRPGRAR